MRRFLPTIIVVALIAVAGFLAFSYEIPEVSVFQVFQGLDQRIIEAEKQSEEPLETVLENLQINVRDLITIGQTYDGKSDISEAFTKYNEEYDRVKNYADTVSANVTKVIEETDFNKVNNQLNNISPELKTLAEEMVRLQQERTTKLSALNTELQNLVKALAQFEDMFYNTKTSDTVQYFQGINVAFADVQTLHTEYMQTVESYYAAKTAYYEQIANKNMFDYLFK